MMTNELKPADTKNANTIDFICALILTYYVCNMFNLDFGNSVIDTIKYILIATVVIVALELVHEIVFRLIFRHPTTHVKIKN